MADLLLELFSEEIPARMQKQAATAMSNNLVELLQELRLQYADIKYFVTARRLAFLVTELPQTQPDLIIERKGPRIDAPAQAIDGFLRSTGLDKEELEIRLAGKHKCYFAVIKQCGQPTATALKPALEQLIAGYIWPKSMRWGNHRTSWVRPLHNICCLLDDEVIPVSYGDIVANNKSYGHRFMAADEIVITKPADYETLLHQAKVVANRDKRLSLISEQMAALAGQLQLLIDEDKLLLEEVVGLVEWPVVLSGNIDQQYMNLPAEVLYSEMRNHQKYFGMRDGDGKLAPKFLMVSNIEASDGGKSIINGNERVLRARLEDGQFFWEQDQKKTLDEWAAKLADMVFHAKLGSMAYKSERIAELAAILCDYIPECDIGMVRRAARLAKADLTTGMVGEFPELQGIMGRYYALAQGEDEAVADAIRDHYMPLGPNTKCPASPVSVVIALADKLDSLAGLFAIGEKPTGSKDPFALRRAALGVIRIVLENKLRVPLHKIMLVALEGYINLADKQNSNAELAEELLQFFRDRLRVMLKNNLRYDVVEAVLACDIAGDDLTDIVNRAKALELFLEDKAADDLLAAYNRANNIVRIEEEKGASGYADFPDEQLLILPEEKMLFDKSQYIESEIAPYIQNEDYVAAFRIAGELREAMDRFFDNVRVNDDDEKLRNNRLSLLHYVRNILNQLASFEKIEKTEQEKNAA